MRVVTISRSLCAAVALVLATALAATASTTPAGHLPLQVSAADPATDTGTPTDTSTSTDTGTSTDTSTPTDTSTSTDTGTSTTTTDTSSTTATSTATGGLTSTCGNPLPAAGVQLHHLIVLVDENASDRQVIGSPDAPYETALAAACGRATEMFGITHPSLPNYLGLSSGQFVPGTFHDCTPKPSLDRCVSADDNVFNQLSQSLQSWRTYTESETTSCQLTADGDFAPRHAPARYFLDLTVPASDGSTDCTRNDVPMGSIDAQTGGFYADLAAGSLPAFSFISPNLVDDGHNSPEATADAYLSQLVPLITAAPNYQAGDTALVITYDEGSGGGDRTLDEDCTDQAADLAGAQPSCQIPFVVVAPYTVAGTQSQDFCTLYCLTRTIEDTFGLPLLGRAGDPDVRDLTADFNLSLPAQTPTDTTTTTDPPSTTSP